MNTVNTYDKTWNGNVYVQVETSV